MVTLALRGNGPAVADAAGSPTGRASQTLGGKRRRMLMSLCNAYKSHELGATVVMVLGESGRHGRLIRVNSGKTLVVWSCPHAHRTHHGAYECAVAERRRRERRAAE